MGQRVILFAVVASALLASACAPKGPDTQAMQQNQNKAVPGRAGEMGGPPVAGMNPRAGNVQGRAGSRL